MVIIHRNNQEIHLTDKEIYDCYAAYRTHHDYDRLKKLCEEDAGMISRFTKATGKTEGELIYDCLVALDEYYKKDEFPDLQDVMFDVMVENGLL